MDLGISGRRALVCASSKGLGRGCAEALAAEGVDLVLNARGSEALEATADAIRAAHGVDVIAVAADITTEAGQAEVLAAAGSIDILVTNAGGPPPGMWSDWNRDDFISAFDANLLGTGRSAASRWVGAWVEERPAAPACIASRTSVRIASISASVASRSVQSSPMTQRRRLQWPT